MSATAAALLKTIWTSLDGREDDTSAVRLTGGGALASADAVSDLASASVAAAALAVAELAGCETARVPPVTVDRRLSSFWFSRSIRPIGWTLPDAWDPIAGDHVTMDGSSRLHTNAPHHRRAAERVLGSQADRTAMARAVLAWTKHDLEIAIVEENGCAAEMRSVADWMDHPQGRAIAAEPLVDLASTVTVRNSAWLPRPARPLSGLRILDLTRVLAGPVATRFLAGYGADVLRIDPPEWNEPAIIPDVTVGKRCAWLNLRDPEDRACFEALLAQSDVLIHGYRPGALEGLGYGPLQRQTLSPGLIDVSLNAYGWGGPWATRRGFDSLVQMSAGIADAGLGWHHADRPVPQPVQALDHATGYLIAASALRAVKRRLDTGHGSIARLSLARTAKLLVETPCSQPTTPFDPETSRDQSLVIEQTNWGPARRLTPPVSVAGADMAWAFPARRLGSASPIWS